MLTVIKDSILALLYPENCRICVQSVERSADGVACAECWSATRIFDANDVLCSKCGAFLRRSEAPVEASCQLCSELNFDLARSAGIYEKALAESVLELKKTPFVSKRVFEFLLAAYRAANFENIDVIVPVPLSARRLRERGFNQAEVIASLLARRTGKILDAHSLVRTRHTPMHRAAMDRKGRELSVRNAFKVVRPKLIAGKNILLVDDILTTGSTASFCAKALKKSGASRINVLTLARAA